MGGEIRVDSQPGEGSCFHFTVPFVCSTVPSEPSAPIPVAWESAESFSMPPHLLVVDDVKINRLFLSETLPLLGIHSFELASNGQEALERLQEHSFDLVLMDCQMPVMDGYDATRALRCREQAEGKARRTPVIALTAGATEDDRAHSLAAGMDDLLTKPVRSEELRSVLTRWLRATTLPAESKPTAHPEERPSEAETTSSDFPVNEAAFDVEYRAMGKERVGRLVRAFFQDMTRNMEALRAAVQARDAIKIDRAAHALKGCCGVVYATRMIQQCKEMQSMGRSGALQGVTRLLEQLEEEGTLVQETLGKKQELSS